MLRLLPPVRATLMDFRISWGLFLSLFLMCVFVHGWLSDGYLPDMEKLSFSSCPSTPDSFFFYSVSCVFLPLSSFLFVFVVLLCSSTCLKTNEIFAFLFWDNIFLIRAISQDRTVTKHVFSRICDWLNALQIKYTLFNLIYFLFFQLDKCRKKRE